MRSELTKFIKDFTEGFKGGVDIYSPTTWNEHWNRDEWRNRVEMGLEDEYYVFVNDYKDEIIDVLRSEGFSVLDEEFYEDDEDYKENEEKKVTEEELQELYDHFEEEITKEYGKDNVFFSDIVTKTVFEKGRFRTYDFQLLIYVPIEDIDDE